MIIITLNRFFSLSSSCLLNSEQRIATGDPLGTSHNECFTSCPLGLLCTLYLVLSYWSFPGLVAIGHVIYSTCETRFDPTHAYLEILAHSGELSR